jgi:hypothetical protein
MRERRRCLSKENLADLRRNFAFRNDRILVIYGAGHLGWLRQDVVNDATVKLSKLAELIAQP